MTQELTFDEFKQLALRTESKIESANVNMDAFLALIKLYVKVGTLLDYTKKGMFYNNYSKYDAEYAYLVDKVNDEFARFLEFNQTGERTAHSGFDLRLMHGLLGVMTESSELAEVLEKLLRGDDIDAVNVLEEMGDIDWYKAITFDTLQLSEQTSRKNVIDKLKARFPDAYSDELAANRDLESERKELEKDI